MPKQVVEGLNYLKNLEVDMEQQEQQLNQCLVEISQEHKNIVDTAKVLSVSCTAELEAAVNFVQRIVTEESKISGFKDIFTRPFKRPIRRIEGILKPYSDELKIAKRDIKNKIESYNLVVIKKQKEQEEQSKKTLSVRKTTSPIPKKEEKKVDGLSFREEPDFRVVDPEKIPYKFSGVILMKPDEKAIEKLVKAGVSEIDGIEIFTKTTSVISKKKPTSNVEDDI